MAPENIPRLETDLGTYSEAGTDLGKNSEAGIRSRTKCRGWKPTLEKIPRLETDLGNNSEAGNRSFSENSAEAGTDIDKKTDGSSKTATTSFGSISIKIVPEMVQPCVTGAAICRLVGLLNGTCCVAYAPTVATVSVSTGSRGAGNARLGPALDTDVNRHGIVGHGMCCTGTDDDADIVPTGACKPRAAPRGDGWSRRAPAGLCRSPNGSTGTFRRKEQLTKPRTTRHPDRIPCSMSRSSMEVSMRPKVASSSLHNSLKMGSPLVHGAKRSYISSSRGVTRIGCHVHLTVPSPLLALFPRSMRECF
jgi:hypothetical protein